MPKSEEEKNLSWTQLQIRFFFCHVKLSLPGSNLSAGSIREMSLGCQRLNLLFSWEVHQVTMSSNKKWQFLHLRNSILTASICSLFTQHLVFFYHHGNKSKIQSVRKASQLRSNCNTHLMGLEALREDLKNCTLHVHAVMHHKVLQESEDRQVSGFTIL